MRRIVLPAVAGATVPRMTVSVDAGPTAEVIVLRPTPTPPIPGKVYLTGPAIRPAWLASRRFLVDRVLSAADACREAGPEVAVTDDDLLRGRGMLAAIRPSTDPHIIIGRVLIGKTVRTEEVYVADWDGKLADWKLA